MTQYTKRSLNEYEVIWANGRAKALGKNLIDAVKKMKIKKNVQLGLLVRVSSPTKWGKKWSYWDSRVFAKHAGFEVIEI